MPYQVMGEEIAPGAFNNDSRWERVIKARNLSVPQTSRRLRPQSWPHPLNHRPPPPHVLYPKPRKLNDTLRYPSYRKLTSRSCFGPEAASTSAM